MPRFPDRNTRLTRQRESSVFAGIVMPIAALIGLIGFLALLLLLADHHFNDRWEEEAITASAIAAALPFALLLFRWMRGHFHRELRDP